MATIATMNSEKHLPAAPMMSCSEEGAHQQTARQAKKGQQYGRACVGQHDPSS
jgi:hypothetical protein